MGVLEAPLQGGRHKGAGSPEGVLCVWDPSSHSPTGVSEVGTNAREGPQPPTPHRLSLRKSRFISISFFKTELKIAAPNT